MRHPNAIRQERGIDTSPVHRIPEKFREQITKKKMEIFQNRKLQIIKLAGGIKPASVIGPHCAGAFNSQPDDAAPPQSRCLARDPYSLNSLQV
jgi:hypothetical protein